LEGLQRTQDDAGCRWKCKIGKTGKMQDGQFAVPSSHFPFSNSHSQFDARIMHFLIWEDKLDKAWLVKRKAESQKLKLKQKTKSK
jgi:hypothetical protein